MRTLILVLISIMALLMVNILGYVVSEDYRFFLKKLKYQEEIVYESNTPVDDTNRINIIDTTPEQVIENNQIQTTATGFTFLDALSGKKKISQETELPPLSQNQKDVVSMFLDFNLIENLQHTSLFGLTSEYPDPYYEYISDSLTLYIFSTKTYSEIQKIFTVLEYETPFTLNETNTFGSASFFINLDPRFSDDSVRIVVEYKNQIFGLKIKKDMYNSVKEILQKLK